MTATLCLKKKSSCDLIAGSREIWESGISSDVIRRVWEHTTKQADGFTKNCHVDNLVYFEVVEDPGNAIRREKRLKFYKRKCKIDLIEKATPDWNDLYQEISGSCDQVAG